MTLVLHSGRLEEFSEPDFYVVYKDEDYPKEIRSLQKPQGFLARAAPGSAPGPNGRFHGRVTCRFVPGHLAPWYDPENIGDGPVDPPE